MNTDKKSVSDIDTKTEMKIPYLVTLISRMESAVITLDNLNEKVSIKLNNLKRYDFTPIKIRDTPLEEPKTNFVDQLSFLLDRFEILNDQVRCQLAHLEEIV
jgi:hypothetical protein